MSSWKWPLGILRFGNYIWKYQKVSTLEGIWGLLDGRPCSLWDPFVNFSSLGPCRSNYWGLRGGWNHRLRWTTHTEVLHRRVQESSSSHNFLREVLVEHFVDATFKSSHLPPEEARGCWNNMATNVSWSWRWAELWWLSCVDASCVARIGMYSTLISTWSIISSMADSRN